MKKVITYAAIVIGILLVIFIGLSLFIGFYLTDERVEALLIPRLEENLGRTVAMEDLQVSLLRGIRIDNFLIKEEDGVTDFFRAEEFVLSYELLPLLRGRLIISEARLLQPSIRVNRDRQGRFNFQTLAFLEKPPETRPRRYEDVLLLPLALTIDQVAITRARIMVEDQLGQFPGMDGTMNASISVSTADGLDSLVYHGRYDFTAEIHAGRARPEIIGNGEFGPETITFRMEGLLQEQRVHLEGAVNNWREAPEIQADLSSDQLDIEQLVALIGSISPGTRPAGAAGRVPGPSPPVRPAAAIGGEAASRQYQLAVAAPDSAPAGLAARGRINVAQAVVRGLQLRDLTASYSFDHRLLRISDLSTRVANGLIAGNGSVDLGQQEPAFEGALRLVSLQAGELANLLAEQYGDFLTGTLNSMLKLSGRGREWQQISKTLAAAGEYTVRDGRLREFPITAAVAELLDLPELRQIGYESLEGNVRVKDGQVLLDSTFSGRDLRIEATGTIGLDGEMNVPVALYLLGPLAEKIRGKAPLTRYLATADGGVSINIRLTGPVTSPRPALDTRAVGERLREQAEEKLHRELERILPPGEDRLPPPARDLLKELLRRN